MVYMRFMTSLVAIVLPMCVATRFTLCSFPGVFFMPRLPPILVVFLAIVIFRSFCFHLAPLKPKSTLLWHRCLDQRQSKGPSPL
jgi:hypothetical protein